MGYRKGAKGGTWIARFRDDAGKQHYHSLGAADDALEADGVMVLSYGQAQSIAREWFSHRAAELLTGEVAGPYTVREAMADYLKWYAKRRKSLDRVRSNVNVHILPLLGDVEVAKLTRRRIENWHERLAETPARVRTRPGDKQRYRGDDGTPEAKRGRQSTANRILVILKAALNRAVAQGKVSRDDAWRRAEPFRNVEAARVRYLTDDEIRRLVNACHGPFRLLLTAALLTGARYGELIALEPADLDLGASTLQIRTSKSGKSRHVVLTDEAMTFFARVTAGKSSGEKTFTRSNGKAWGPSQQRRPLLLACSAASIDPPINFHAMRHTHASRLAMQGVPLAVIGAQLGHRDSRMVERHYGHMSPSYVSSTIRSAFGSLGIVEMDTVTPMMRKRAKA